MSPYPPAASRPLHWKAERTAACLALAFAAAPAFAQDGFLDTSIRASHWSEDATSRPGESITIAEAWVRAGGEVSDSVSVKLEAWASGSSFSTSATGGDIREAFVRWRGERLELRLGRQVIAWGKSDRINPTDMLAARDWRRLVIDEDDNRLGQTAAMLAADFGDGRLTAVWLPVFRSTAPPVAIPDLAHLAPGRAAAQGALRYDASTAGVDWSVSVSSVFDRMPTLGFAPTASGLTLTGDHPRRVTLGADAAFAAGAYNLRFEGAAYLDDGGVGGRHAPRMFLTAGADRDFDRWNINAQVLVKANEERTASPASPAAALLAARNDLLQGSWDERVTGAAVRVRRSFLNDTASAELTATALQGGGQSIEAKLAWSPADGWRLVAGGRYFSGAADTFFGAQKTRSGGYVELRRGF